VVRPTSARLTRPTPGLVWQAVAPTAARTALMFIVAVFAVLVVLPVLLALAGVPDR
jgi:hypothetical protein